MGIYAHGIRVRHHCGAEPTRHAASSGHVGEIRGGARAPAPAAAALGVETPPGAAGRRLRGAARRRAAPRLPAPARTLHGTGFLAEPVPAFLVDPRRCARTPPRPHGPTDTNETEAAQKAPRPQPPTSPGRTKMKIKLTSIYVNDQD